MYHSGVGSGPALVFLHEGVGSARQWKTFPWSVGEALGCPVLVYSRRGHGHSDPLDAPREPRFMHDEAQTALPALLEALVREHPPLGGPLVLVGHSDGATIALLHVALRRASPVRGIVAIAPHVFVEAECLAGVHAAVEAFSQGDLGEKLAKYHRDPDHTFFAWADIWRAASFRHWNIESLLPRVTVPVQLIQGRDDEYGTMEQCRAIARGVEASVDVLELGDCGHNPPRARPAATHDAIVSFVRRLDPQRTPP
jgi:pimeloyl-ACP methyl ester carboxylesterase